MVDLTIKYNRSALQLRLGKRAKGFLISKIGSALGCHLGKLGLKAKRRASHARLALVEWADLEEALTRDLDKVGSLVRQIHPLVLVQTKDHLVLEDTLAGQTRFADDVLSAVVVEELVVNHTRPPSHDTVLAAELIIADKRVSTTIKVA
ncbi:hypothetical protein HG531_001049 [Fusarium graminearum]|nr:hypothetical protein HG531_001049 [Fusarium graminearum]